MAARFDAAGGAVLDVAFRREGDGTRWDVLRGDAAMVERKEWGAWRVTEPASKPAAATPAESVSETAGG